MKTIIEEAIDAFQMNHDDRCLSKCNHDELISRAKNYERRIQKDIGEDVATRLEEVRDDWLITAEIRKGSYAAFIQLIFDVAVKFAREIE